MTTNPARRRTRPAGNPTPARTVSVPGQRARARGERRTVTASTHRTVAVLTPAADLSRRPVPSAAGGLTDAPAPAFVWGIDPAVSRVAFAFAPADGGPITVETLTTASDATEGERLGLLDRQVRIFARQRATAFPPTVCWVEQPSGRFRNLTLAYAVGVIQAALFETVGVPVWTIPSSTWKQRAVGVGNATKAQVMAWAERVVTVDGQDEADAVGIAYAGRAMVVSERWTA